MVVVVFEREADVGWYQKNTEKNRQTYIVPTPILGYQERSFLRLRVLICWQIIPNIRTKAVPSHDQYE